MMSTIPQPYGASQEVESSWEQCISLAHLGYMIEYVQEAENHEAAIIDAFLKEWSCG